MWVDGWMDGYGLKEGRKIPTCMDQRLDDLMTWFITQRMISTGPGSLKLFFGNGQSPRIDMDNDCHYLICC